MVPVSSRKLHYGRLGLPGRAFRSGTPAARGLCGRLPAERGPELGRPLVDRIQSSALHNLKELRPRNPAGSEIRMLFVFDPFLALLDRDCAAIDRLERLAQDSALLDHVPYSVGALEPPVRPLLLIVRRGHRCSSSSRSKISRAGTDSSGSSPSSSSHGSTQNTRMSSPPRAAMTMRMVVSSVVIR
ncbi:type II toxin-antitoxin system RelE/ParE family toxin [Streptomyces gardneri]|nr:type II toxin-antitoxin system RelE/ParE family toxin [Streptomyces gardneri]